MPEQEYGVMIAATKDAKNIMVPREVFESDYANIGYQITAVVYSTDEDRPLGESILRVERVLPSPFPSA